MTWAKQHIAERTTAPTHGKFMPFPAHPYMVLGLSDSGSHCNIGAPHFFAWSVVVGKHWLAKASVEVRYLFFFTDHNRAQFLVSVGRLPSTVSPRPLPLAAY